MKLNFSYLMLIGALSALTGLELVAADGGGAAAPNAERLAAARGLQEGRRYILQRRAEKDAARQAAQARAAAGGAAAAAADVCAGVNFAGRRQFSLRNEDGRLSSQRAIQALNCATQDLQNATAEGATLMDADEVDGAGHQLPTQAAVGLVLALAYIIQHHDDMTNVLSHEAAYRGAVDTFITTARAVAWMNAAGLEPLIRYELAVQQIGVAGLTVEPYNYTAEEAATLLELAGSVLTAVQTVVPGAVEAIQAGGRRREVNPMAGPAAGAGAGRAEVDVNAEVERNRAARQAEIAAANAARDAALAEQRRGLNPVANEAERRRAARDRIAMLANAALEAGNQGEHNRLDGILTANDLAALEAEVAADEARRAARRAGAGDAAAAEAARLAAQAEADRLAAEQAAAEAERLRVAGDQVRQGHAARVLQRAGREFVAQQRAGRAVNQDDALLNAIIANDVAGATTAIGAGANVNAQQVGGLGLSALHLAAKQGNEALVQLLLNNGANVNLRSALGATPIGMLGDLNQRKAHLTPAELAVINKTSAPGFKAYERIGRAISKAGGTR